MEFRFEKMEEEKNHQAGSMVGAGSSKTPPFEKKEVEKSHPDGAVVGSAGSSISLPPVHHQDGKMLVKLKIPKSGEEIEEGAGVEINYSEWDSPSAAAAKKKFSHFCRECNKGFLSGKALGGHMSSAHVQAKDYLKKLKIKKSDKLFRGDESNTSDADHEKFFCPSCSKAFGSSKSLYGHMRCHPERDWRGMEPPSSKEPHKARPVVDEDEEEEVEEDDDESEEERLLENFDDVDDSAYGDGVTARADLTESLSGWAVTGKRGREGLTPSGMEIFAASEEEKQKVYDAVNQLLRLVNGDSLKADDAGAENEVTSKNSSTPSAEFKDALHEVPPAKDSTNFPLKKRKFNEIAYSADDSEETLDGSPSDKGRGKGKFTALIGSEFSSEKSLSSEYSRGCGLFIGNDHVKNFPSDHEFDSMDAELMKIDKRRKSQKAKGPKSGETIPANIQRMDLQLGVAAEKHKCSTCKKIFPTHQALGGHRASHNKPHRMNIQNTVGHGSAAPLVPGDQNHANPVLQLVEWNQIGEGGGGGDASKVINDINVHECNICGKIFQSGQALGGHKRCHYAGTSSQVASSPDGGGSEKSERKVLEFDLNVALEEDPNAAGYGT